VGDRVDGTTEIKEHERCGLVGVSGLHKIVVYGGDGRFSRVATTVGRLTRGEQRMIIDVLHEPRCNNTFD